MIIVTIYLFLIFLANFLINKYQLILSNSGQNHQSFVNKSIPLTGGLFLLLPVINLFLQNYPFFLFVFFALFILGLLSDLNILVSPKKRFFLQFIFILFFSIFSQLEVTPTKIVFFDNLIKDNFLGYIFTTFCLMILINGSNFIDGLNGLLLGYFSLIILLLLKLDILNYLNLSQENYIYLIFVILFLLTLNFFNKLFLGDSGAYSLSFLIGFILIKTYSTNQFISPYFIILLLWYPCFENLFSIIRKIFFKKRNPLEPDTEHLHQKLFTYCKVKFKISNLKSNILSSLIILFFNLFIFYFASKAISHTIYQLSLLVISVITYLTTYLLIHKIVKNMKF